MAATGRKQVKLCAKNRRCTGSPTGNRDVPWLNISGTWLETLGFHVGDTVNITTRDKLLIIEALETEAREQQDYKSTLDDIRQTLKKLSK